MGLEEAEPAKPLASGCGLGVRPGAGSATITMPSFPPCHSGGTDAVALGRDSGCTQCPPQNRPLSSWQLKLCLVNYSAARSHCFSVLIRRAGDGERGKKHRKERERAAQGSKAAEVSKTEI